MTSTDAPTVTVNDLPDSCPHCDVTADEITGWPLGIQGNMLQVVCPRCFTAVAPVWAVAAQDPECE